MIQKTSQRQLNAVLANARSNVDEPEEWGQWIRNKHYSLEVTQHPLRARMCGFGDKDRRPLAPAAVAKMIVRREDNTILDVDDIDVDFFVVTVDLWSADGKQEMNLVLHPSSADRFVPAHVAKLRKRGQTTSAPARSSPYPPPHERPRTNHPPTQPAPGSGSNSSSGPRPIEPTPTGTTPLLTPTPTPSFTTTPGFPFPPTSTDPFSTATTDPVNPWSYSPSLDRNPFHAPTLPSIHAISRSSPAPLPSDIPPVPFSAPDDSPDLTTPFRGWNDVAAGLFDAHNVDPVLRGASRWSADALMIPALPPTGSDGWTLATQHAFQPFGQTLVQSQPQTQPQPQPQSQLHQQPEDQLHQHKQHHQQEDHPPSRDGQHLISSLPRHAYTRTLVGPLSANAQRLQDEHRKPGIFFLFQDLSIRTEGTFRLRMRLMNVGIPPAPNGLSNSVHTGISPVLAQIFTEPFTVYSAKRFPGVPSTTALSIAFGNQGQKLPLRNRHKQPQRSRRLGSASSDDESS